MRRFVAILAGAVVLSTTGIGSAQEQLSEQIVVVRLPSPKSRVDIRRERGDAVAIAEFENPPDDLLKTLKGQTGRFFQGADRRWVLGNRAIVALELSSTAVEISTKRVEKTPAVILTFTPTRNDLHPDHRGLFGAIPGLFELQRLPSTLPPEPGDAPCPGRIANDRLAWAVPAEHVDERLSLVDNPTCAEYLASRLAFEAMGSGRSLAPFERWAYNFDPANVWPDHRRSRSLVALVVSEVLIRTGYYPEAEVVLGEARLFRARSLRYYQAAALAHLELERNRPEEVRSIVGPLLETAAPDEIKELAGLIHMLSATRSGRAKDALRAAEAVWTQLEDRKSHGNQVAALAGEVALAAGDNERSRIWFERAADGDNGTARRAATLRLADASAQKGAFRRAKRILAQVRPKTHCEKALVELRRKVMALQEADPILRLLENVVQEPSCPAEAREARFALAKTYVQVGLPELAVPLAWKLRDELPVDYRHTNEPLPLLRSAVRRAAARLARNERWQASTQLYEEHVAAKGALELLDGPTLLHVARAYIESGAPRTASNVLTIRLAAGIDDTSQRAIASTLIEAYLRDGDTYRADLVADYFEKTFEAAPTHLIDLARARLHLIDGDPEAALRRLRRTKTPDGDPTFQRLELTGRALARLGQCSRAAEAILAALRLPNPAELARPEAVVRILSQCAREDRRGPCGELYALAASQIPTSKRLDAHAQRLGWIDSPPGSDRDAPAGLAEMLIDTTEENED